ncbi:CCA tRNA nucleotidyltransferase [Celeribacter sp.]|uniref:CCA tRNA nucleotidyltransferase n=1 Tax=Celeribacter sp. TaxID=1890673 RepID=UPI003A95460D
MKTLNAPWLSAPNTQRILSTLTDAGFEAYVVGGTVRNTVLGAPVSDIDISTSARPDQVTSIFEAAGIKVVPTGIDHGTVTAVLDGEPFEITTFRKDVETDGRRAVVQFSDMMAEDAFRRDFTMNALYCDAAGVIYDPVGGLPDLERRYVRFIDDPDTRIREDYLRILRFFRFHAWYGDDTEGLDAEGLAACAAHVDGLDGLSRERVGAEFLKLLSAPHPETALGAMEQSGVLARLLPGGGCKTVFALSALEADPDPIMRLAAMGGEDVSERLRLSKKQAAKLDLLRIAMGSSETIESLAYRHGGPIAKAAVYLRSALFETALPEGWQLAVERGSTATFPVKARDLPASIEGPALGRALREMEQRWINARFDVSKSELLSDYLGDS